MRRFSILAAVWIITLSSVFAGSARAVVVELTFSGNYDTYGDDIFGLSGPTVPYSFSITYDTSLDTNTQFFAAGATLGGKTTTHAWYGYSASGITASTLAIGTQIWSPADLSALSPASGVSAELWFDSDIATSTPTRAWIFFYDVSAGTLESLELGGWGYDATHVYLIQSSLVIDDATPGVGSSDSMTITRAFQRQVSNSAIQSTDQPKYRWRYSPSSAFPPEFQAPAALASGLGSCSMQVPSQQRCGELGLGVGCILVSYGFAPPPPSPPTSGSACCAWEGKCEQTCFKNTCAAGVMCPPRSDSPACLPGMICVNTSFDCLTNQAGCDGEYARLRGLGVPECCFRSAGAAAFQWSPAGLQNTPDTDADRFPDTCDNCKSKANADQADLDGDQSGDVCDTNPFDPNHCSDTDSDHCDDCSSGHYDPSTDHVVCLPEPAVTLGLAAGVAFLRIVVARKTRSRATGAALRL